MRNEKNASRPKMVSHFSFLISHFAIDIGNSRVKFALYERDMVHRFQTLSSAIRACVRKETVHWGIGSVCPAKTEKIVEQIRRKRPSDTITVLTAKDIPLKTAVDSPEKVGIDRLLAAYAAVCWRRKHHPRETQKPMLVCDLGTAITIDLVSPDDIFLGGAILPGMNLATKCLRRGTAQLPNTESFATSPFPGTNTADAIRTGIFNGTIGAIRRFYDLAKAEPLLILTGGDAEIILPEIQREFPAFFLPQLVLDGIHALISSLGTAGILPAPGLAGF